MGWQKAWHAHPARLIIDVRAEVLSRAKRRPHHQQLHALAAAAFDAMRVSPADRVPRTLGEVRARAVESGACVARVETFL